MYTILVILPKVQVGGYSQPPIHLTHVALHEVAWCMLYGVHRTCAETAAVLCGTSHVSAVKHTTSVDIQKIYIYTCMCVCIRECMRS